MATIDPDGSPRQAVVWYTVDGDEIVLNSAVGRRWPSNLVRDPRLAFSVVDDGDGYHWIGLTGRVTVVTDQAMAQSDIAGMARRYHADEPGKAERLIRRQFERAGADQLPDARHRAPCGTSTDALRPAALVPADELARVP